MTAVAPDRFATLGGVCNSVTSCKCPLPQPRWPAVILPRSRGSSSPSEPTGQEVRLSNAAEIPTFYFVVERETAAVIDFAPCVEGPRCPSVAPGATVQIPYSRISGYQAGSKEAIVFWWRSARTPAGLQPDGLRSTVAEL
jgi:hypothetical protein